MRSLLVFVIVAGLGLGAALTLVNGALEEDEARAPASALPSEPMAPEIAALPTESQAGGPERTTRNVTPSGVLPAPDFGAPPVRLRVPTAPRKAEEKKPDKPERFHRIVVLDAGRLRAGKTVVSLDGVTAKAEDARCKDEAGREWPCGQHAKTALQRFIRTRAVDCDIKDRSENAATALCRVGDVDIGAWLVRQGWAEPAVPERYAEDLEAARKEKLGQWSEAAVDRPTGP